MKINYKIISKTKWYRQGGAIMPYYSNQPYRAAMTYYAGCSYNQGENNYGYLDMTKERQMADSLMAKQKKNKKYIDILFAKWNQRQALSNQAITKINQVDFSTLSNTQLFKLIKNFSTNQFNLWKVGALIESFDSCGEEILNQSLKNINSQFSKDQLKALTYPYNLSYLHQLKLELVNLFLRYQGSFAMKSISKKSLRDFKNYKPGQRILKQLSVIQKNYFWAANSWASTKLLSLNYFYGEFKKIINNKQKYLHDRKKIIDFHNKQQQMRKQILKNSKLPPHIKNIFYFFAKQSDWREVRKARNMLDEFYMDLLRTEIARRNKIKPELLLFSDLSELTDIKFSPGYISELECRKKHYLLLWDEKSKKAKIVSGQEAREIHAIFLRVFNHQFKNLQGVSACAGKIKGTAKLVITKSDFKKFNKGDIMVTQMTRPEFLPIMKKAGAIVTDEGGITSHAAILSRELNIPCVIGTQVATNRLNDGDEVEVDAFQGIVRLLK
ncbi:MAG: Phosphoenolpyruvate synthase [Parcubacteria group bacterium GW2011_GWA2_43_17]|nr:MAG: Phosphoenolpyruvate synthase [Parcubacteria group bacterium GW2011_GWA2_43_17]KKT93985.1 MAG: Phosphoenolpyruvate synthase [Parcubacteria group bacterium GW2011_GWF2_45_11]OGY94822.1 MAG: hypothetical protein A2260_02605 [Candidatus Komeilibacteria bacterium RIFOXYA2_FULL_45_9]OGY96073.1 MAG: hypothetical protein A3J95_02465 [Candidatus Komeilibacteria bacterium RIFOXYC2_FULL_45_12]HBV02142.1 hypothetical protein [Candidatus Komeilibacteria bacterium]